MIFIYIKRAKESDLNSNLLSVWKQSQKTVFKFSRAYISSLAQANISTPSFEKTAKSASVFHYYYMQAVW